MKINIKSIFMSLCALSLFAVPQAQAALDLDGYDPVAYHTESVAARGNQAYSSTVSGVTYLFKSAGNKALFDASPQKYLPQYGGYCAYAVSNGYKVKADPEAWTVLDGKLYLNFNKKVRKKWLKKPQKYIEKANKNWPNLN